MGHGTVRALSGLPRLRQHRKMLEDTAADDTQALRISLVAEACCAQSP